MIYIASMYSLGIDFDNPEHLHVLEKRVDYTMKKVHELMLNGDYPCSPILACHEMAKKYDMPRSYDYWMYKDRDMISRCTHLIALKMKDRLGDWIDSVGMTDEIAYAKELGMRVVYLDYEEYD